MGADECSHFSAIPLVAVDFLPRCVLCSAISKNSLFSGKFCLPVFLCVLSSVSAVKFFSILSVLSFFFSVSSVLIRFVFGCGFPYAVLARVKLATMR